MKLFCQKTSLYWAIKICIRLITESVHGLAYLSPYTRCLFLLGLPPGVISLCCFPASSNSFCNALLSTLGSSCGILPLSVRLLVACSYRMFSVRRSDLRFSMLRDGDCARGGVLEVGVTDKPAEPNSSACKSAMLGKSFEDVML